jgi:cyclophilin family peptidyl-prolyl cis-trans isomerase
VATEKRARQRANRQAKIEEQVKEEQRAKKRSWIYRGVIVAVALIAVLVAINVLSGDDEATEADEEATTEDAADEAESDSAEDTAEAEPVATCTPPADQVLAFDEAPAFELTEGTVYNAVLDTTAGEMTVALDAERAPNTVNNFVFLARNGYYDCVTFHRVIEGFVIQGGDPVGDPPGTGGPGYTFDDELPEAGEYELGSLAMANSGPNTNGSQFFIITGEQGQALPPQYSLFGSVTDGLDVATAIQSVATDGADKPIDDVVVNSVTIVEG